MSDTTYGNEVLLRPEYCSNPENDFEFAREKDMLFEVDMNSIEVAYRSISFFKNKVLLFINVFPSTLIHPDFMTRLEEIEQILTNDSISNIFKINEGEKKDDIESLHGVIGKLKNKGYLIALDDTGKDNSTLNTVLEINPIF